MHHKVFIIDNNTIITGSFNPSKAANEKNDENILIINNKDIAKRFLEEFDYLTSLE
jgi:phosphatidylserine/phosphatidylglycerophosphate/cardiolipin synthase-like enzyme